MTAPVTRAADAGRRARGPAPDGRVAGASILCWMVALPVAALDNPVDLAMLLLVAFLLFGKQLPEVARTFGKGIREVKESLNLDEMSDALSSVNEVRTAVSPQTIARAAIPGIAEMQDTVAAARGLVIPSESAGAATAEAAAAAEAQERAAVSSEAEASADTTA